MTHGAKRSSNQMRATTPYFAYRATFIGEEIARHEQTRVDVDCPLVSKPFLDSSRFASRASLDPQWGKQRPFSPLIHSTQKKETLHVEKYTVKQCSDVYCVGLSCVNSQRHPATADTADGTHYHGSLTLSRITITGVRLR